MSIVLTQEERDFIAGRKPLEDQIHLMEKQLLLFDYLTERMYYITNFFMPDPAFSPEAILEVSKRVMSPEFGTKPHG